MALHLCDNKKTVYTGFILREEENIPEYFKLSFFLDKQCEYCDHSGNLKNLKI